MKVTEGLAIAVLSAVIGSAATIFTSSLSYFNASRELDIKMVNVALLILSAKEKGTETEQARRYALRTLEHYGGVDIPDNEFEAWATTGTVPSGDFPVAQNRSTDTQIREALEAISKSIEATKMKEIPMPELQQPQR